MTETFRKIFEGVADHSKAFELFNIHTDAPFDERRYSGELYAGEWFEVSESVYWYFLEIMPPIYVPHGFAVCEAVAGAVYRCYFKITVGGVDRFFQVACDRRRGSPTHPSIAAAFLHDLATAAPVAA